MMDYEAIYTAAYNEATKLFQNRSDVDIDDVSHGAGLRAVAHAAREQAAALCEQQDAYGSGDAVEMKSRCAEVIRAITGEQWMNQVLDQIALTPGSPKPHGDQDR